MDIEEFDTPRTHIIIKDVITKEDQDMLWDEIKKNESNFKETDNALVISITNIYPNIHDSLIRSMFWYNIINNLEVQDKLSKAKSPVYYFLRFSKFDLTKISAYKSGDYDWHTDFTEHGLLNVLYMMCKEPQKFIGGDFVLKWDGKEKVIPFENNKIIIFARNTPHRVSEIKLDSNNFLDRRFTLQFFADLEKK